MSLDGNAEIHLPTIPRPDEVIVRREDLRILRDEMASERLVVGPIAYAALMTRIDAILANPATDTQPAVIVPVSQNAWRSAEITNAEHSAFGTPRVAGHSASHPIISAFAHWLVFVAHGSGRGDRNLARHGRI
jgi:hypothetical protein